MATYHSIRNVFNYMTPISSQQTHQRAFVDRAEYTEKLVNAFNTDGLLVISGYSSIGKTTLINIATSWKELRKINAPFRAIIRVLVTGSDLQSMLSGISDGISKEVSGRQPDHSTPASLAEAIHSNQLLVVLDGVEVLDGSQLLSQNLRDLCKIWTDLEGTTPGQSKIVLITSGLSNWASDWLREGEGLRRVPHEHITISSWDSQDLLLIIKVGAERLNVHFTPALQNWMAKVACGLPSAMNLLAALSARHANYGRDRIQSSDQINVDVADLQGIFGERQKFENTLFYDSNIADSIGCLSASALLSLYMLGMNGGKLSEDKLYEHLTYYEFAPRDILGELKGLITSSEKEGITFYSIKELSYGIFAFLRLYYRAKLRRTPDDEQVAQVITSLIETKPVDNPISDSILPPSKNNSSYKQAIFGLCNDGDSKIPIAGTCFLATYKGQAYLVTCAHVLTGMQKETGDTVALTHSLDTISNRKHQAKICWLRTPETQQEDWFTRDDIALLTLITPTLPHFQPLEIVEREDITGKSNCYCFGYPQIRRTRGDWIKHISCGDVIGAGFIELKQSEGNQIEDGLSGAPLSDNQGNILGMIQAIDVRKTAYLTPINEVIHIIKTLNKGA